MSGSNQSQQAAQNQHYVPRFILRNFLSNEKKEQVSVFRKSDGKGFITSIRNIMAERRFHDFAIDENYLASFEEGICKIEELVLPTYQKVISERKLDGSPEQRATLAMLMAFQLLRTRQQREQFSHVEQQLANHLKKIGSSIDQLDGYEPFSEESLTRQHIEFIRHGFEEFSQHIATKDFLLLSAPPGRSFYLSDNPVCMYNAEPAGPFYGNIGLAVQGIEIYLPLTADLMLAAWCPTLIQKVATGRNRIAKLQQSMLLQLVIENHITQEDMRHEIESNRDYFKNADNLIYSFKHGLPLSLNSDNMDYNNSLQMAHAREYVICKQGDFKLASRFVNEFPNHKGRLPTVS